MDELRLLRRVGARLLEQTSILRSQRPSPVERFQDSNHVNPAGMTAW
jgi:hypothetical protein